MLILGAVLGIALLTAAPVLELRRVRAADARHAARAHRRRVGPHDNDRPALLPPPTTR
jgi:hypothetical protein